MVQPATPSIEALEQSLAGLQAGQRVWFWCGPKTSAPHPPLLIHPLADDPEMANLRSDILKIPREDGAPEFLGLGSVDTNGVLQLGSADASAAALKALALWTAENIAAHPGLARLRNTRMLRIDGTRVAAIHRADELWSAIPELVLPGTMNQTARTLAAMETDQEAWFWLSARGPDGKPFLALESRDLDGAGFAEVIGGLLRRSPADAVGIKGVARLTDTGLVLTTSDAIEGWQAAINGLKADWGDRLSRLDDVRMLQLVDGSIKAAERCSGGAAAPSVDLSVQSAVLSALTDGQKVFFWFASESVSGGPVLLLAADRSALKPQVKAAKAKGASCKGMLRRSAKGWLEFQTKDEYDGFIPQLAGWVARHRDQWPALSALIGARMTRRDTDGNIVGRFKDDSAWKK